MRMIVPCPSVLCPTSQSLKPLDLLGKQSCPARLVRYVNNKRQTKSCPSLFVNDKIVSSCRMTYSACTSLGVDNDEHNNKLLTKCMKERSHPYSVISSFLYHLTPQVARVKGMGKCKMFPVTHYFRYKSK